MNCLIKKMDERLEQSLQQRRYMNGNKAEKETLRIICH